MNKHFIVIILSILLVSCNSKRKEIPAYTVAERKQIKEFAVKLTNSINKYEYNLIRSSWDNTLFKKKVTKLSKTERNVFNHFFKKEFAKTMINNNIDMINRLKFNNGKLYFSKIVHFKSHSEITFSMKYNDKIDFWRYRVELKNKKPKLCDLYSFKDNIWQSKNMRNIIRLNSKFTAKSKERKQANLAIINSEKFLRRGDTLKAIEQLYKIPETHLMGNGLSLKKLNLAFSHSDSMYSIVLNKEYIENKSTYIDYIYCLYFRDTLKLNEVYNKLSSETGEKALIDSLRTFNYFWN